MYKIPNIRISDVGIGVTGATLDAPLFGTAPGLFIHRERNYITKTVLFIYYIMALFVSWTVLTERITIKTFRFSFNQPLFIEPPFFLVANISSTPFLRYLTLCAKTLGLTTTTASSLRR